MINSQNIAGLIRNNAQFSIDLFKD